MKSNPLQSVLSSWGSGAEIALLKLFIVQASKEPGHLEDKRIPLKTPCKRKYLFSPSVPTKRSYAPCWKPEKMKMKGP